MVGAYKASVASGISPVEFWTLTPYLTKHAIKAASDENITRTWILANLMRAKKLPKLEKLLKQEKPKSDMENRLKTALSGLSKKKGGTPSPQSL